MRTKKNKTTLSSRLSVPVTLLLCVIIATKLSLATNTVSSEFPNLAEAYEEYGFAYCFSVSVLDRGIDEPEEYVEDETQRLLEKIRKENNISSDSIENAEMVTASKENPNVIFIQLESFFDVNYLKNITFSENPTPNFTRLKETLPHGFLTVPCCGAGTANTEFEVLSGMNLDSFGAGEYPYETLLQDSTCESMAYIFRQSGYTAHAVHNNSANFYDRNLVFSNLGFDTFTSIEYMQDIKKNALGWAKDEVIGRIIPEILRSTENADFIYAISVQAHGKYLDDKSFIDGDIKAYGLDDENLQTEYEFYINEIFQMDEMISDVVKAINESDEPTVVVFFGDHLPGFRLTPDDLSVGNLYTTEYVICSNFGLEAEIAERNLNSYELSSYVLNLIGNRNGFIPQARQRYSESDGNSALAELISYDMLYGDMTVFGGISPYNRTEIQMGFLKPRISSVQYSDCSVIIRGNGFNEFSYVLVGNKECDITVLNCECIIARRGSIDFGETVRLEQRDASGNLLSVSDEWVLRNNTNELAIFS